MEKRIIKIGNVQLYEEEAIELFKEEKCIVSYGGVYKLCYSEEKQRVYGQKVINQKGIANRGRFFKMTAEMINNILGEKLLT